VGLLHQSVQAVNTQHLEAAVAVDRQAHEARMEASTRNDLEIRVDLARQKAALQDLEANQIILVQILIN
jgi:hypothetical protein